MVGGPVEVDVRPTAAHEPRVGEVDVATRRTVAGAVRGDRRLVVELPVEVRGRSPRVDDLGSDELLAIVDGCPGRACWVLVGGYPDVTEGLWRASRIIRALRAGE